MRLQDFLTPVLHLTVSVEDAVVLKANEMVGVDEEERGVLARFDQGLVVIIAATGQLKQALWLTDPQALKDLQQYWAYLRTLPTRGQTKMSCQVTLLMTQAVSDPGLDAPAVFKAYYAACELFRATWLVLFEASNVFDLSVTRHCLTNAAGEALDSAFLDVTATEVQVQQYAPCVKKSRRPSLAAGLASIREETVEEIAGNERGQRECLLPSLHQGLRSSSTVAQVKAPFPLFSRTLSATHK